MEHPFALLTPSQVRDLPRQTVFTSSQETLQADVEKLLPHINVRAPDVHLTLLELQTIMDYKLAFGQNRPALRAIIKKNSNAQVKEVTTRGLKKGIEWQEAMVILCELKGVGPATASLILHLINPMCIPFFRDETTVELVRISGGRKGIKYTLKTYKQLFDALTVLAEKINQNKQEQEQEIGVGELEEAIWHTCRLGQLAVKKASKRKADDDEAANGRNKRKT